MTTTPLPKPEDLEAEAAEFACTPRTPEYFMEDEEVEGTDFEYSTRAPTDWVSSGPLGEHGRGPGRRFPNWATAECWARGFYKKRLRGRIPEAQRADGDRWAFVIRNRGEKNE